MRNRTYGGVRGQKTKVGRKLLLRFLPTRFKRIAYNLISRMSFLLVEKITLHKIICHVMANNFFVEIFYLLLSQFN